MLQGALSIKRVKILKINLMEHEPMSRAWRIHWPAMLSHVYKARKITHRSALEVANAFFPHASSIS